MNFVCYKFMGPSGIHEFILPPSPPLLNIRSSEVVWGALHVFTGGNMPTTQSLRIQHIKPLPIHTQTQTNTVHKGTATHTHSGGIKQYNIIIRGGCSMYSPSNLCLRPFYYCNALYASYSDCVGNLVCVCVWLIVILHLKGSDVITSS